MTNKTEIILDKQKVIRFFKSLVLSLVLSFFLLLITALFGNIAPAHSQNKWNSDVCYFGILNKDGYSGTNESIQVLYDYTMDVDDLLTGNYFHQKGIHLWLQKVQFSASTFVVKIATFAKPKNVMQHYKNANNDKFD